MTPDAAAHGDDRSVVRYGWCGAGAGARNGRGCWTCAANARHDLTERISAARRDRAICFSGQSRPVDPGAGGGQLRAAIPRPAAVPAGRAQPLLVGYLPGQFIFGCGHRRTRARPVRCRTRSGGRAGVRSAPAGTARYGPPRRALLERAAVAVGAAVGPLLARVGLRPVQVNLSPSRPPGWPGSPPAARPLPPGASRRSKAAEECRQPRPGRMLGDRRKERSRLCRVDHQAAVGHVHRLRCSPSQRHLFRVR